mmetsp:Transcript_20280/g.41434  ORF Transcript_20280/g.41434 Transcript_20280/m.41434 type:complete len:652 (-) Transcript_20280:1308-3263(-)
MDYTRERSGVPGSGNGRTSSRKSTSGSSGSVKRGSTSPNSPPVLFKTLTWVLILLCSSFSSFYFGVWTGIQAASLEDESRGFGATLSGQSDGVCTKACLKEVANENGELQRKVEELAEKKVREELQNKLEDLCKRIPINALKNSRNNLKETQLFSKSITHFATGLVRVANTDLMKTFDFGVPPNPNTENYDALILYNKKDALPSDETIAKAARQEDPKQGLPFVTANTATENCDTMNVVFINNPGSTRQCLALVGGQYQSYHIQRWMRRSDNFRGLNADYPLKLTSRGWTAAGRMEFTPPKDYHVKDHQDILRTYLNNADDIKNRLKSILSKMKTHTVVVLTCNFGQSELLMNFACSARSRGFDLSNILVFPTDFDTKELAEGMGFTTFYEEKIMASIPKAEANAYGDKIFTRVMFAKVVCVQLVNELGYDLLFSDVDVVWYRNPVDYFHERSLDGFDVFFQDDGSRQERYAPYSANSGFYYVRSNQKTKHLFRSLLYASDLINAWYSHQQVLIALLTEHNSLLGLNVKILPKEMEEFPGGVQFHRNKEAMKKILRGESDAYILHMSWTKNKDNKVLFFKQFGEWYLQESCVNKHFDAILSERNILGSGVGVLLDQCCSAEPLVSCHYRDKPSKIPCRDSPPIDRNGESWW